MGRQVPPGGQYNNRVDISPKDEALIPRIYEVVKQVPRGLVATYGSIAEVVGGGCDARLVGDALGIDVQ